MQPLAPIKPTEVRRIRLGEKSAWFDRCREERIMEVRYDEVPHAVALAGDWAEAERLFLAAGKDLRIARRYVSELRSFYTLDDTCLWVAFGDGHLWWAFAEPEVTERADGARVRRLVGDWRPRDIYGEPLLIAQLSTRLTKTAASQLTICKVEASDYLLRRINGELDPLARRVSDLRLEMITATKSMIADLDWADFELLVDLILSTSGWRRVSAVGGGGQKDTDLILEQTATGERAFVQVKSSANAAVFRDYLERFTRDESCDRFFFTCHSPQGRIEAPDDPNVHLWLADALAEKAVQAGLVDWLVQKRA